MIHPNAASRSNLSTRSFLLGFSCATSALSLPAFAQAPSPERQTQAATLVTEAITLAERESKVVNSRTRLTVVRGAASLLPRLSGPARSNLTQRWMRLAFMSGVTRRVRSNAFADFFDEASQRDAAFTRSIAGMVPDAAARAGGFLQLSERAERTDWRTASELATLAQRAARQETSARERARAMTFVAHRLAVLDPELRMQAVVDASSNVRLLAPGRDRDYLMAEVVGAAAKFDLGLARRVANDIGDEELKKLAQARVNLSEASQTTLSVSTADRIAALAKSAARYDVRSIPILIQLPPQSDVLQSLSDALPPVYPTAQPAIDVSLLERMWDYSNTAEASVYKDQLQSRLARLMVLHDLWRGRSWGKQLAWRGGRVQVGAFLNDVLTARRSRLKAAPLQDVAERNVSRAIVEARNLAAPARAEAMLLIAGQLLA